MEIKMSQGVNKVILVGNLGADVEMRQTTNGTAVANFRIATSRSFKNKAGERQERTEWHRVVAWGKLATLCTEYLSKGRQVYLEGRLETRQWDDSTGNKRYTTEVHADTVTFLGSGRSGTERQQGAAASEQEVPGAFIDPEMVDDVNQAGLGADEDVPF